ncbi:MAG: hypothetical protein K9G46_15040 [Flavobacteriales bacterium]|nr:hypothetical protein [Flavobacteriales bacterium]
MNRSGITDIAEIIILPGNISHVTLLKGAEVDLNSAKRLVQTLESLSDHNIPYRAGMFDISNVTYINQDARDFLNSGEGVNGKIVASALISTSFLGKTIGNLFLSMSDSTTHPTKYFDSPIRAEHWLRTLMRETMEEDGFRRKVA